MPSIEFPADRQRYRNIRHCPSCGKEYGPDDFHRTPCVFICARCGFDFYQNPVPAAVAVIAQPEVADAVLLLRRQTPPNAGLWCVPGGFVSYGESPAMAAQREIREEVGLNARIGRLLHAGLVDYTYKGHQLCVLEVGYVAHLSGRTTLERSLATPEASEVAFVQVDDVLRRAEMLAFPEQASLLRAFKEELARS